MEIFHNYSLKDLNTFGVNARAAYFVEISSEKSLIEIINNKKLKWLDILILGGGSNILFTKNYNGLILKNEIKGIKIVDENKEHVFIKAGGGLTWSSLVDYCVDKNYGGIENLTLIPGTVGAAPVQNIGAYGVELKDVLHSVDGMFLADGEKKSFLADDCEFSYRNSIFKTKLKNSFFITKITLKLSKKPKTNIDYNTLKKEFEKSDPSKITIKQVRDAVKRIRMNKLPDPAVLGNAGSFFKNPEIRLDELDGLKKEYPSIVSFRGKGKRVKLSAGWLIEQCGWKGIRFGNTGTYEKQSLVIVNHNNATGREIHNFARLIQDTVYEKFKIQLVPEVNII
ncbi:MAG: UDP-N-acetylenolpyruvoylglucosamine reductase [Ignavibacteria bacterium RBG_13_36_8]|nr:MAG: UDP-N-acetylenolpyruvoylglucosamine reductase [Ignavibacteria bacterium RBG_13_36_8]